MAYLEHDRNCENYNNSSLGVYKLLFWKIYLQDE